MSINAVYSFKLYSNVCCVELELTNSKKIFEEESEIYARNIISVLSSLSFGLGYSAIREIFSLHDINYMIKRQYKKNQEILENIIETEAKISMERNLEIEKNKAMREGNYDGGYPSIGCIGDGQWSKRSYNYNYTANSSTAVLIGVNTKKVLYVGVKNKYCKVCNEALIKESS